MLSRTVIAFAIVVLSSLSLPLAARAQAPRSAAPATAGDAAVLAKGWNTVATGDGALRLTRLQRAGGKAMDADAFLRGYPIAAGAALS